MADFNQDIPEEYLSDDFDFGFTAADEGDLNELLELDASKTTPDEIAAIKSQLDLILEMNSTCEGANQVKAQYDELLKAKLLEIERAVVPLLLNLKKNKAKDYIYWPGKQREAQCDLQIQKVLGMTRSGL
jgi:hypothetical protein